MTDSGSLAIAILIILGFVLFIAWAKTPRGKSVLRESLGPPDADKKKRPAPRKRTASGAKPTANSAAKKFRS